MLTRILFLLFLPNTLLARVSCTQNQVAMQVIPSKENAIYFRHQIREKNLIREDVIIRVNDINFKDTLNSGMIYLQISNGFIGSQKPNVIQVQTKNHLIFRSPHTTYECNVDDEADIAF